MTRCERQQRDIPCLLDRLGQAPLVRGANAREPPRHNLAALSHKPLQQANIAIRDCVDLLRTELANLLAAEEFAASAGTAAGPARTARARAWTVARSRSRTGTRTRTPFGWSLWSCRCVRRSGRFCLGFFRHRISSLLSLFRHSRRILLVISNEWLVVSPQRQTSSFAGPRLLITIY